MIRDLSTADPAIVALCGRSGSGKSAAAEYLAAEYGFEQLAFADALKDILGSHLTDLGLDYAYLHEPGLKDQPIAGWPAMAWDGEPVTARRLMQTLGDWGRSISPDYWVACLERRAGLCHGCSPVHDRILITDVRYWNEARWLRQRDGVLLRLQRDGASPMRSHSSEEEVHLLQDDLTIVNNGPTLEGLHAALRATMADLRLAPRPARWS